MSSLNEKAKSLILYYNDPNVYGYTRWNHSDDFGTGVKSISYSFISSLPGYYARARTEEERLAWGDNDKIIQALLDNPQSSASLSQPQRDATEKILDYLETVVAITFELKANEIGNIAYGQSSWTDIDPATGKEEEAGGNTFILNYKSRPVGVNDWTLPLYSAEQAGADVWINKNVTHNQDNPWASGNQGYLTILHETCHALGLSHPYDDIMSSDHDLRSSIMSRVPAKYSVLKEMPGHTLENFNRILVFPSTLMPLDIMALQYIYGPNTTATAGNDTYGKGGAGDWNWGASPIMLKTIWDAGGDDDKIDCSDQTLKCVIDLNAGHYSSIGIRETDAEKRLGLDFSNGETLPDDNDVYDGRNNLAIAYDYVSFDGETEIKVIIENAIGGSNNDVIIGNDAANELTGGRGNDTLEGGKDSDAYVFNAGDGQDTILDSGSRTDSRGEGDGQGKIKIGGLTLGVFSKTNGGAVWQSEAGAGITAQRDGNDLMIRYGNGDSITIKDWREGELGITLSQQLALTESYQGDLWSRADFDLSSLAGLESAVPEGCSRFYTVCLQQAAREGDRLALNLE
ncbi:MAG: M10 family metallopeptidase C-terminal domain-containing protein, partial [Zoogloeaceae bacterium]|nr:M10 family metallopeptidase C-terminal domain-containing protein [Zoogloeaceae bacterium]